MVQLSTPLHRPGAPQAQRHRQTDRRQYDANSRSYCVTLRSAKNENGENEEEEEDNDDDGDDDDEVADDDDKDEGC